MSKSRLWTLATTLVMLVAGQGVSNEAAAQTVSSPYSFTPGGQDAGLMFGYAQDRRGYLGIGPGGGALVGARYGRELLGPLGLELSAYVVSGNRTIFDPLGGVGLVAIGEGTSRVASVDARFRFTLTGARTWRGLAPYIVGGAGVAMDVSPTNQLDAQLDLNERVDFGPSALVVVGGGTRYMPGDRFVFFAEIVSHLWRQGTPNGYSKVEEFTGPLRPMDWVGLGGLVGGVSYRF